jgi:predicted DNA-binding transcriptional regulator YafY
MEPLRLHYKYRNWYIYGFCRTRQDYREFRLSRLLNLLLTRETFQTQHELPEVEDSPDKVWQDQLEDVVVRVGPEAIAEALDQFHPMDKQFHNDGSMTLRIPVCQPLQARWLWNILLGFGSGAEVLEPPELRRILKEQLLNTLKHYEEV